MIAGSGTQDTSYWLYGNRLDSTGLQSYYMLYGRPEPRPVVVVHFYATPHPREQKQKKLPWPGPLAFMPGLYPAYWLRWRVGRRDAMRRQDPHHPPRLCRSGHRRFTHAAFWTRCGPLRHS